MGQSKTKLNILVCGLDNSGKTTIINHLKPSEQRAAHVTATVGYSTDTFTSAKVKFTAFDMGGAKKFRALWESYYGSVQGIIFVVDSAEALRLCVVKDEIEQMVEHPAIASSQLPFLFFANKIDLGDAKTPVELMQILELPRLMVNHPFNMFASSALTGLGIAEGIEWLRETMLKKSEKKRRLTRKANEDFSSKMEGSS